MLKKMLLSSLLMCLLIISGCGDGDVDLVKDGYMEFDKSVSVGDALDNFHGFKSTEWTSFESSQKRKVVEFHGIIDKTLLSDKANNDPVSFCYGSCWVMAQFLIQHNETFKLNYVCLENDKGNKDELMPELVDILITQIYADQFDFLKFRLYRE